jgi:Fe-S-cluster containining protein
MKEAWSLAKHGVSIGGLVRKHLAVFNGVVDADIKGSIERSAQNGEHVTCRKGCSACCRQLVTATTAEAIAMVTALHDAGRKDVLIKAQTEMTAGLEVLMQPEATNRAWFQRQQDCVFLEDGACLVYEVRPLACRMLQVMSPADQCSIEAGEGAKVAAMDLRHLLPIAADFDCSVMEDGLGVPRGHHPLPAAVVFAVSVLAHGPEATRRHINALGIDPDVPELFWAKLELINGATYADHGNGERVCCSCKAITPQVEWKEMVCPRCQMDHVEFGAMMQLAQADAAARRNNGGALADA